jgi:hypothetical protein
MSFRPRKFFCFFASFNPKKHDQYGQDCGEKIDLTFIFIFSEIDWFRRFHWGFRLRQTLKKVKKL